jgi:hypothetical protein
VRGGKVFGHIQQSAYLMLDVSPACPLNICVYHWVRQPARQPVHQVASPSIDRPTDPATQ